MALQDKDRIFTNLYGYQPWNLDAARVRGDWDNTKALLDKGQDAIIGRDEGVWPAGARWCGRSRRVLKWSFMP